MDHKVDTPGWPLLRRVSFDATRDTDEARKMSVVQWVMALPNRSLPLPIRSPSFELSEELRRILKANASSCRWFAYEELQNSTVGFSSGNLIGDGGSSRVYKGCLTNGQQVAIKLPKRTNKASTRDFIMEVNVMSSLQHKHIMPLIGLCIEDNNLISVYTYFSRGNLEENLHGESTVSWEMRFKVAIGTAEALSYLHNSCSRPVIHRDVKSSNILLSDEFEPQLSDFNLALWAPTTTSHLIHSDVLGTFGYLAPEYFMYGRVSDKIDVYAFGVVLLELLSGRKPIHDDNPKGCQESLVMWATPILERNDVLGLLDPSLDRKYDEHQARRMTLAASLCLSRAACLRPTMCQVLRLLLGEENVEVWINSHTKIPLNDLEDETYTPASSIRVHLSLALLDTDEDDDVSTASSEQNHQNSLEVYLQGRCSRNSSFD